MTFTLWSDLPRWARQGWRFSRPHTIIGTSLSVVALWAIALFTTGQPLTLGAILTLALAWLACLAGNLYIVGLNQLFDIDIDRINKPHLPLAAGAFTRRQGWRIVAIAAFLALTLSIGGLWLWLTVALSLGIGTAYSVPPIRLKRFSFWAAFCILAVRGVVVNLGLSGHFNQQFDGAGIPGPVWILTGFVLLFSIAIALFKDVPDLEGDRHYQIQTLTIALGKPAVFALCCTLIAFCYGLMIAVGLLALPGLAPSIMIGGHLVLLLALGWRSRRVDLGDKGAIARFYQFIWLLFFAEYFLFPLACWAALN